MSGDKGADCAKSWFGLGLECNQAFDVEEGARRAVVMQSDEDAGGATFKQARENGGVVVGLGLCTALVLGIFLEGGVGGVVKLSNPEVASDALGGEAAPVKD